MGKQKDNKDVPEGAKPTPPSADGTPPAPPPDMAKAAEEAPDAPAGDVPLSYPPPYKGNADMEHRVMRWKEGGRIPCAHSRNRKSAQCYYPLNIIKTKGGGGEPVKVTLPNGEVAYKAECSWDPNHMGTDGEPQYVLHSELFPPQ